MAPNHRVLQLLPTLAQGGAELYVQRLAKAQVEAKSNFSPVVCSFLRGGPVEELLHQHQIPLELLTLPRASIRNPLRAFIDLRRIYTSILQVCKQHRIDLIQTHLSDSDWLGLMVGLKLGIPVALTFHSSKLIPPERDPQELRARLRIAMQSRFYKKAGALIAVGSDVQNSLMDFPGVNSDKVHLIPSAIEVPPQRTAEELLAIRNHHCELRGNADVVLASVGRLVPSKGHDRLIRMMPQVLKPRPRAKLWIIGEGPERPQLEALIAELKLQKSVCLLGGRNDVAGLLPAADIFVTGTLREGLGLAVAEGMAAELPVIGFNVTGIVDIIEHEKNGILIDDGDLSAFANAVIRLANDQNTARSFGQAGRVTSLKFDVQESRRKTEVVYQQLLTALT